MFNKINAQKKGLFNKIKPRHRPKSAYIFFHTTLTDRRPSIGTTIATPYPSPKPQPPNPQQNFQSVGTTSFYQHLVIGKKVKMFFAPAAR